MYNLYINSRPPCMLKTTAMSGIILGMSKSFFSIHCAKKVHNCWGEDRGLDHCTQNASLSERSLLYGSLWVILQQISIPLVVGQNMFSSSLLILSINPGGRYKTRLGHQACIFRWMYVFRYHLRDQLLHIDTVENTSMNPRYFISMYWANFCRLTVNI